MTLLIAVLDALAAIPAIAGYVNQVIQAVIGWYVARQQADALAAIADAAAFAARAQTDEDRYAAAKKWQQALSHPRISV